MKKSDLKAIEEEAKKIFMPETLKHHEREWLQINTKCGLYRFYFDYDGRSIIGRFTDIDALRAELPPREQKVNGVIYQLVHYPSLPNGKFNFHYHQCEDFIDTIERFVE